MNEINYQLDLSSLFVAARVPNGGVVTITEHTHDYDPAFPKNHWLYPALLGFKKYEQKYGKVKSYASIGAGSAIDAIGAHRIFKSNEIALVDIHPQITPIAKMNVENNVDKQTTVVAYTGDLCQPLNAQQSKFDLVYANIPNIPSDQPRFAARDSASYYTKRDPKGCPKLFDDYLLTLQYLFLKEAKQVIKSGGAVVDAIGGRLPYEILEKLFIVNGYKFEELASVFKIQTEPGYILKGYAEAEERGSVEFDFYYYEEAQARWLELEDLDLSGPELKKQLAPYKVNARTAYGGYLNGKRNFGHVVHILCGKI